MIRPGLLPHQITILTAGETVDDYGNTVQTWAAPAARTAAAYVRPAPASEDIADRDAVTAQWQVHTNDLAVSALNRVVYDGVTYEVDGQPLTWKTLPGGRTGHTKLLLRRVDG